MIVPKGHWTVVLKQMDFLSKFFVDEWEGVQGTKEEAVITKVAQHHLAALRQALIFRSPEFKVYKAIRKAAGPPPKGKRNPSRVWYRGDLLKFNRVEIIASFRRADVQFTLPTISSDISSRAFFYGLITNPAILAFEIFARRLEQRLELFSPESDEWILLKEVHACFRVRLFHIKHPGVQSDRTYFDSSQYIREYERLKQRGYV